MEVAPDVMPADHPKMERQVQKMSLGQENLTYDTMVVNVIGPDQGEFILAMLIPGTEDYVKSGKILAGGDAAQFQAAVNGFYTGKYGVSPIVTRTFLSSDGGATTEDALDIHTVAYAVETPTAIGAPSVENVMVLAITTTASIEIVYPAAFQLSDPPLSGTFFVECYNTDGNSYATRDMDVTSVTASSFKSVLEADCSFLAGKISVTRLTATYAAGNAMGVEFQVNFFGVAGDLGQYRLIPGIEAPIVGVDVVQA